jgi:hypothetical protein
VTEGLLQVGDTRRPHLDVSVYDGSTVVTLRVLCLATGTDSLIPVGGPVAQPSGAGRWTATSYYTLSSPGEWFEKWLVTNAVTGLGAGATSVTLNVDGDPPAAPGAAWATVQQYANFIGGTMPDDLPRRLRYATLQLRAEVGLGLYDTTDTATALLLAEATCLQAAYGAAQGWSASGPGLERDVAIGSVKLGAAKRQDGGSGALSRLDPLALELLTSAGLGDFVGTDILWRP